MKRKTVLKITAVLAVLFVSGCGTGAKGGPEATIPPVEAVTGAPVQEPKETMSPEEEMTGGGKEEIASGLRYFFREEAEEAKDGEFVYFKSSMYYPVFEGKNADAMNEFVASLAEPFRECLPEARENAKFDYEESLTVDYVVSIFPEEEEFIVSCLWETEQYVTLFVQSVSDTGGVHPNVSCRAYVVNVVDATAESFEDMLEPYGLTKEEIVVYTTEKLRTEHGEILYCYGDIPALEKDVERLVQNHQWYFNENGLVLFSNAYEIAAYAYGMIECEISYEELEQGLKK